MRPVDPVVPRAGFLFAVTDAVLAYDAVFIAELLRAKIRDIIYIYNDGILFSKLNTFRELL